MIGVLASLLTAAFGSAKDLVSKGLSFRIDGTLSAFASFLFALPYYLLVLLILYLLGYETFAVAPYFFGLVLLRALTDSAAESFKMHALGRGDISLIAPFLSLAPLFLLLTSPLITGDQMPAAGVFAVIFTVAGTLLLAVRSAPAAETKSPRTAILLALCSSLCFSLNTCFDRLAVRGAASPALSGFAMTAFAALFLYPAVRKQTERAALFQEHGKQLWTRGLFEVLFMVTKLYALTYLQAPYVASLGKVSLLFSIVGGKVIYKEADFVKRLLAGLLIMSGVVTIALLQLR